MTTATKNPALESRVQDILNKFGLNFRIEKFPSRSVMADGSLYPNEKNDFYNLVNTATGEAISTSKKGYTISQNEDVIRLVLMGIEKFGDTLSVTKAGSLNGGRKVFVQLAIDGYTRIGEDEVRRYVTIIDSNDGSCSLAVGIGDLTMSCSNQFTRFYRKSDSKMRHSASLEKKLVELPLMIENALGESLAQMEIYRVLADTPLSENNIIDKMVKAVLGFDRHFTSEEEMAKKKSTSIAKMDALYAHIEKEIAQKGATLWGLHSGVTSFTTHELKAPKRDNGREESLMIGTAYDMNQKSLRFVTSRTTK